MSMTYSGEQRVGLWTIYKLFLIMNITSWSFWQSMGNMNKQFRTGQKWNKIFCLSIFLSLFSWIWLFDFFIVVLFALKNTEGAMEEGLLKMSSMFWKGETLHFRFQNLSFKRNIVCWVRQKMLKADKRNNLKHYRVPVCIWTCASGFHFIFNTVSWV